MYVGNQCKMKYRTIHERSADELGKCLIQVVESFPKDGKLYIFDASRHSFHKRNPVTQLSFKPVNAILFFLYNENKHLKIEGNDSLKAVCMAG